MFPLSKAGCFKIFKDTASGGLDERAGLQEALAFVRAEDTLVAWKLDRLGRSLRHLIETVSALQSREIGFQSLTEAIDTSKCQWEADLLDLRRARRV